MPVTLEYVEAIIERAWPVWRRLRYGLHELSDGQHVAWIVNPDTMGMLYRAKIDALPALARTEVGINLFGIPVNAIPTAAPDSLILAIDA